ncbi:MAG: amidase [Deltaproteobacteria bacterium]|nr:amidase [Deltaproteobacteria bacterium]
MHININKLRRDIIAFAAMTLLAVAGVAATAAAQKARFHLQEATIAEVHQEFRTKRLTATQLVNLYLKRIEAYNGRCVTGDVDPATGLQLGSIRPIENAGQVNALITLNLRGKRSKTDKSDNDPKMPDALETAQSLDDHLRRTGKFVGPLHGIPLAVKDQFDTFDMRSTSGAAAPYANDRPPRDAEVIARLRQAGAIILAKANLGEYASGVRSTDGGTTCNPYDTTRSPGSSSGGPGAAVAANLVMCAIGEETGASVRNPAFNSGLVGVVATNTLVSRAGLIPASLTDDRPGVLCRNVRDAALVLSQITGYDPRDPVTAASVGHKPAEPYERAAAPKSLKGYRIGVVREFMQPLTKADEEIVRVANLAIAELAKTGAEIVDPGPGGQLFKNAIAELVPSLYTPILASTFRDALAGTSVNNKAVDWHGNPQALPPDATLRIIVDAEPNAPGQLQFALNSYLRERGDKNIKTIDDLLEKSTFYDHPPIEGSTNPAKVRLQDAVTRTERLRKKSDNSPLVRRTRITNLDITDLHAKRTMIQMLVNKVMADHKLDALVYPTKTLPAPLLGAPEEPQTIKSVSETVTVMIDGVEYQRNVERVLDTRNRRAWRLSPFGGLPAVAVPAGFMREVYDRKAVTNPDGSVRVGDYDGPKPVDLPMTIDFLGRQLSEATLLKIAAAYENVTRHRRPPKSFPPLPGEP